MKTSDKTKNTDIEAAKHILKKKYYIYCIGTLCSLASYTSVAVLQSSINIEDGLGLYSLAIAYSISVAFGILVAPSLLRQFGCKPVLIAGEIGYLLYVIGNFFPEKWVMLSAGAVIGMGEACVWLSIPIINVNFGRLHFNMGDKQESVYIQKYIGTFFAISQINTIVGHSLSYAILHGGKLMSNPMLIANETYIASNETFYMYPGELLTNHLAHCGKSDCQDHNVTSKNMSQYVPNDKTLLHIFFGIICLVSVTGILLHVLFLENVRVTEPKHESRPTDEKLLKKEKEVEVVDEPNVGAPPMLFESIRKTLSHCVHPSQLLITPLSFYYGVFMAFVYGELPRAFASCIQGVEQVGICMVAFATVNCSVAYMSGNMSQRVGRNFMLCAVFCIDCLNYLFCLQWTPSTGSTWPIYLIFMGFGLTDGMFKTSILMIYSDYFPTNQEIAYTAWNIIITLGVALHFGLSTYFCVWMKIYICLALYSFGMASYALSECLRRKNASQESKVTNDDVTS